MGSIENSLILMMIVQVVKSTNREFVQEEFSDDIDQPGVCVRNGKCVVKKLAGHWQLQCIMIKWQL